MFENRNLHQNLTRNDKNTDAKRTKNRFIFVVIDNQVRQNTQLYSAKLNKQDLITSLYN